VIEAPARVPEAAPAEALHARLIDAGYTTERIEETLGGGRISFWPTDVEVHARRLRTDDPFSTLVKLFLLGLRVARDDIQAALTPLDVAELERSGWVAADGGGVTATVKLVPHGDLLIASDRDAGGPTAPEWVAGVHPPSATLAKLTVRRRVERALDVGTGNGIQALLASRHARTVTATDVNPRALSFAALNARLNGADNVEYRQGSYFEPVADERFELLTCNPPYVISPESRFAFRDSGLPGDAVSRKVVEEAPAVLEEGAFAHLLISWGHAPGDWWSSVENWIGGRGCDAWLLHFGSDDPVTHAAEWLKQVAREDPDTYRESLGRWLEYLGGLGIEAIAHGAVILRRRTGRNWTRRDSVSLDRLEQASDYVLQTFAAQTYLNELGDDRELLDERFVLPDSHRLEQTLTCRDDRTEVQSTVLGRDDGLAFRVALDLHTAHLIPLLDRRRPLREALAQRAAAMALTADEAQRFELAALPAMRRLLELGLLLRA
jgi:2-polyprenyl-3-methyl-5-hydroxy-6-metoxy-1,4-benzoquinol methylase